jgi:hypothetical protein
MIVQTLQQRGLCRRLLLLFLDLIPKIHVSGERSCPISKATRFHISL